VAEIITFLLH